MGETHIGLDIFVLKVEGVLPHVDANDRDQIQERVLVSSDGDFQTHITRIQPLRTETKPEASTLPYIDLIQIQTYEPAPTRTLYRQSGTLKLLLEVLKGFEGFVDGFQ